MVIRASSEVAMTSLTSSPRFLNLWLHADFLSQEIQIVGNTNVKCFQRDNSCDLDPGDKHGSAPVPSPAAFPPFHFLISRSLLRLSRDIHFPSLSPPPLSLSLSPPPAHVSALWHTRPVHLFAESVVVMLCGSCWGQWPSGVLWCNDPCHRLWAPPPPLHSLKGRKGCKVTARVEAVCYRSQVRDWTDSDVYCKGELAGQVHRLSLSPCLCLCLSCCR